MEVAQIRSRAANKETHHETHARCVAPPLARAAFGLSGRQARAASSESHDDLASPSSMSVFSL